MSGPTLLVLARLAERIIDDEGLYSQERKAMPWKM